METHHLYTGMEFNQLLNGKKLYRFMTDDEKHQTFQYHEGLNIDINPFNPTETTCGLYFVTEDYVIGYLTFTRGLYMREVMIPDDASVYTNFPECRADRLILGTKYEVSNWIVSSRLDPELLVRSNGCTIMYLNEDQVTLNLCQLAIQGSGWAIRDVPNVYLSDQLIYESVQNLQRQCSCDEQSAIYRLLFCCIWWNPARIEVYQKIKKLYQVVDHDFDEWLMKHDFTEGFHEKLDAILSYSSVTEVIT